MDKLYSTKNALIKQDCINKGALEIIALLENAGFEAYIVGGCLRDLLLGKDILPTDWDIATSATPSEVCKICATYSIILTGLKYGTISIKIDSNIYDVTTFRIEGAYHSARFPKNVLFTRDLAQDVKRRDFSINALYYAPRVGIVDMVGGLSDLKARIIRCVGNPLERFNEDALRILRALRFASRFGFRIEKTTQKAMNKCKNHLLQIANERICVELGGILESAFVSKNFQAFYGIFAVIMPEIKAFSEADKAMFLRVLGHLDNYKQIKQLLGLMRENPISRQILALSAIGHFVVKSHQNDNGKHALKLMLERLRFDNTTKRRVYDMVNIMSLESIESIKFMDDYAITKLLGDVGLNAICDYLAFSLALGNKQNDIRLIAKHVCKCIKKPYRIKDLAINGDDLCRLQIPQGRIIGIILENLLNEVMQHRLKNTKNALSKRAQDIYTRLT